MVHFGQTYNRKMLEILGVLIIRANLVEDALVSMLTALLETPRERAEALFYASQNMKARLDMIQAVASKAGLSPGDLQFFADVIKKVESVSRQRNQLVHGEWEFKGDKFSVQERKPLARAGKQRPVDGHLPRAERGFRKISLAMRQWILDPHRSVPLSVGQILGVQDLGPCCLSGLDH